MKIRVNFLYACTAILLTITANTLGKKKNRAVLFLDKYLELDPTHLNVTVTVSSDHRSVDAVVDVVHDFTLDVWVDFSLAVKNARNTNFRNLFTYDMNVCNLLGKDSSGQANWAYTWLNNFLKYGTLPKKCPIQKGHYFWRGLKIEKNSIPVFIMPAIYRTHIKTYFRENSALNGRIYMANLTVVTQLH